MTKFKAENYIFLSIFASISTITLKFSAYFLTNSVGLLSDAIESFVNLAASLFAFLMIKFAKKPKDKNHPFGHSKIEYFSSLLEGGLICAASILIIFTAFPRFFIIKPLGKITLGILISFFASLINLFVGLKLIDVGRKNRSLALQADGKHLLTDVYTSFGVILAIVLVEKTKILILDSLVATFIALNILWTGFDLVKKSVLGLIDTSIEEEEILKIEKIFKKYQKKGLNFHNLQTRQSGQIKFISFHILFPNNFSIKKTHDLASDIEKEIKKKVKNAHLLTHLEPISDPKSFED